MGLHHKTGRVYILYYINCVRGSIASPARYHSIYTAVIVATSTTVLPFRNPPHRPVQSIFLILLCESLADENHRHKLQFTDNTHNTIILHRVMETKKHIKNRQVT